VGTTVDFLQLGSDACFYLPDGRTLVFAHEPLVRRLIDGKLPRPNWARDWHHVARGLLAVAFDSRDKVWYRDREQPEGNVGVALLGPVIEQANSVLFGVDCRQGMKFQLLAPCDTVEGAANATQALKGFLASMVKLAFQVQDASREGTTQEINSTSKDVCRRLLRDGLQQAEVHQQGATVLVRSEIKMDFGELLKAVIAELPSGVRSE
jgi:hypothetical protein